MKLERLALIAEIVGAFAIVVTLMVLIAEVRGNTDAILAQTIYAQYSQERDRRNRLIGNFGGIVDIRIKARSGGALTESERQRYEIYNLDLLDNYQWQFREVQAGRLPAELIDTAVWINIWTANEPVLATVFDERRPSLDPDFVRYMKENVINR